MLTFIRRSVALKNFIYVIKGVVRLRGQRSEWVKIMFVWALTSPWIGGFYNTKCNFAHTE